MKLKHNVLYSYAVCIILIIVAFIQGSIYVNNHYENKIVSRQTSFNDKWTYKGKVIDVSEKIDAKPKEMVEIINKLPDKIDEGDALVFYSIHQSVDVIVDGDKIYSFGLESKTIAHTPGNKWNFVQIPTKYAGKTIKIQFSSEYKSNAGLVPEFLFGNLDSIRLNTLRSKLQFFILLIAVFTLGIVMTCLNLVLKKLNKFSTETLYLGIFITCLSTWLLTENHFAQLLLGCEYLFSQLAFISLIAMISPIIEYFRVVLKVEKIFDKILYVLSLIAQCVFVIEILLHLTHILELKQTVIVTHVIMLLDIGVLIIIFIISTISKIKKGEINKYKKRFLFYILVTIIAFISMTDVINYNFRYSSSSDAFSKYGSISFILIAFIFSIESLHNSIGLMRAGLMFDDIKEMAYRDTLTGLNNRTAFDQEMKSIKKEDYDKYSIIMIDLNNLKYFNDEFGHECGDMYISTAAMIIKDAFGDYGNVYRIGGDEFCGIINNSMTLLLDKAIRHVEEEVDRLNRGVYKKRMGISMGCSKFDTDADYSLYETMKRADKRMYEYKVMIKEMQGR